MRLRAARYPLQRWSVVWLALLTLVAVLLALALRRAAATPPGRERPAVILRGRTEADRRP
jgi:hypothetical protein